MVQPINIPGQGIVNFPDDMTHDQIAAAIRTMEGGAPKDTMPELAPNADSVRQMKLKSVAESSGAPPSDVSAQGRPEGSRPYRAITEDMLLQAANAASFTFAPKISAKIGELQGKGTYDDLLAKRRKEIEEAGQRLGLPATILANIAGGGMAGGVLSRFPALWGSTAPGLTIAGRVAPTASTLTKAGAGALEGAGYGALQGAGSTDTGQIEDYTSNMLKGGLLGGSLGAAFPLAVAAGQKAITPFPATDPVRAGMVQTLEGAGVPVSAGRRLGNKTLELYEDTVAKLPFGKRPTGDVDPMEQVTAAAMRQAGIGGGSRATPEVLNNAFLDQGRAINAIQRNYHVPIDETVRDAATAVEANVLPLVQRNNQGIVQHFIDRLSGNKTGQLSPQEAQSIRTELTQSMRDFMGANSDNRARQALITLRETLDDSLTRTIEAREAALKASGMPRRVGDAQEMERLRRQYANLHVLTDAIAGSGKSGDAGILTPAALEGAVSRSVGKVQAVRGQGDLNELGKASNYVLSGLPDSFTNTREGLLNPFKVATSPVANWAVNSPGAQSYWANQRMPQRAAPTYVPPAVGAALGPADKIINGLLMEGR